MSDCSPVVDLVGSLSDFGCWEEEVARFVNQMGCDVSTKLLSSVDDHLASTRPEGLRYIGMRRHTIVCRFGEVTIERRLYLDRQGDYRFLLDEAIGLKPRKRQSPSVAALAATLAAHVPFRVAADLLSVMLPSSVSHQSIHNLVAEIGDERATQEDRERSDLFSFGVLPKAEESRRAEDLYLEADGTWISLQRETKTDMELRVGVAYSGKHAGATKDKVVHIDTVAGETFWQHMTTKVAKRFDLTRVKTFTTGGDGAAWIRTGKKLFPGATFRLDAFHVFRSLTTALGFTRTAFKAYGDIKAGRLGEVLGVLDRAGETAGPQRAEAIKRTHRYLAGNADGLGPGPSLGAIESNVDKLAANRMKKRGMSWTIAGAKRMAKLLELNYEGSIGEWAQKVTVQDGSGFVMPPAHVKVLGSGQQEWLRAHVAPLDGPHASRPWVKILREISRGSPYEMTGIAPTRA